MRVSIGWLAAVRTGKGAFSTTAASGAVIWIKFGPRGPALETGRFGAEMAARLTNDGPVTIWLVSKTN